MATLILPTHTVFRAPPQQICPSLCFFRHTSQVSDQALTCFGTHEAGANIAVGTSDGSVTILQLSAGLSEMALNEKAAINNMFDRETQVGAGGKSFLFCYALPSETKPIRS